MTENMLLGFALIIGFYMAWNIGANDVANAFGTSIGSGSLTFRKALVLAAIFEFSGAFFVGSHVSNTIRGNILLPEAFAASPDTFAIGMLASLLGAALWLNVATCFGRPVSTTHAIIGAVIGFGIASLGPSCIQWRPLIRIAASWFVSPVAGGLLGFIIYYGIRKFVLRHDHPAVRAHSIIPFASGTVVFVFIWSVLDFLATRFFAEPEKMLCATTCVSLILAICAGLIGRAIIAKRNCRNIETVAEEYVVVERWFSRLEVMTACYMAFAHGANDVANAIGPIAGIIAAIHGTVVSKAPVPSWILVFGGAGIVIGLAMYGHKVIEMVGRKITEITPTRGFSAQFGTASTVLLCSLLGLPISTTFVLVGALMGVGLARGFGVIDLKVIRKIFMSWLVTIPVSALFSAILFLVITWMWE